MDKEDWIVSPLAKGFDKTYTKYFDKKREPETKKLEDIPLTFL